MMTKTLKSTFSDIPKLNENNYPMWIEQVQRVMMGEDAYEIMTGEEPEPEGNTREGSTELQNWQTRRNNAKSIIYMGCPDQILPHIKYTIDHPEI